ncbi:hypothetical protein OD917_13590 [Flavobacterium sp. SH_e]|uniref:hypothetical protein n=1 Tax=Flavobacterium TaxID=237 RepID=UPI0021E4E6D5|nr:hypothetical protein [Flavobacterium sp. SH_e]MCV2485963.1 hypothetical protein [Flavobacterium sp. SH_e]
MKKFLLLFFILFQFISNAQEIKIITVKEYFHNNQKQFILSCELKNNSKKDKIILPMPIETIEGNNVNYYNYFFEIETNPKNGKVLEEAPPAQMTQTTKLTFKNIIVCEPNSAIKFNIDSKNFMDSDRYFDLKVLIKQISLVYKPFEINEYDKKTEISQELSNVTFYSKTIKSKPFKI